MNLTGNREKSKNTTKTCRWGHIRLEQRDRLELVGGAFKIKAYFLERLGLADMLLYLHIFHFYDGRHINMDSETEGRPAYRGPPS